MKLSRGQLLTLVAASLFWPASVSAQPAQLQANGLRIRQLASPTPGKVMALVEAESPHDGEIGAKPAPAAFTIWVNDGAGSNLTVERNGSRGAAGVTIFLVDESGSYKKRGFVNVAAPVITDYAAGAASTDHLGLFLFSTTASPYPVRDNTQALLGDLANARKRPSGGDTNLYTGLINAIELAGKHGTPGLREVILFSDAGDEAEITESKWKEITEKARSRSVRIHVIVTISRPKNIPKDRYFNTTNALEDLTKATSGIYDKSGGRARATAALDTARDTARKWLVLEADLCGMSRKSAAQIRVEYVAAGLRKAWSSGLVLAETAWAPTAASPCPALCTPDCAAWEECIGGVCAPRDCGPNQSCPGGASCRDGKCDKPCSETCESWQTCRSGECAAKTCQGDEQCGAGAVCSDGTCSPLAAGFLDKYLVWLLAGLVGLLLVGAFLLLRPKSVSTEELEEPAPAPLPEPEMPPAPEAHVHAPDLDALPEVHLEAIAGWPTQGEIWRLYKRTMQVGASKEPGDRNDIVFGLPKISGTHAKFQLYPSGDLWVNDLGSSNGTFVNGRRLEKSERCKLKPGDQIKISKGLTLRVVKPDFDSDLDEPIEEGSTSPDAPSTGDGDEAGQAVEEKKPDKKKTRFDPGNR